MSNEHLSHYHNLAVVTLAALGIILALSNYEATGRMLQIKKRGNFAASPNDH
jgi:hypothetical protein